MKTGMRIVAAVLFLLFAGTTYAAVVVFDYGSVIQTNGSKDPASYSNAPWLEATFASVNANNVTLTLSTGPFSSSSPYAPNPSGSAGLAGSGEYAPVWAFNLDPGLNLSANNWSITRTGGNAPTQASITWGPQNGPSNNGQGLGADGAGNFNIKILWAPSPTPSLEFRTGETAVFNISYSGTGLTENSFGFLSAGGAHGQA
jgi:hypothetical protein